MATTSFRLTGVELYFSDLPRAQQFYNKVLGLQLSDEQTGHHAQFDTDGGFVCVERKGAEDYLSADKAVLFFEVPDLDQALARIGRDRVVKQGRRDDRSGAWAVLHDPEGHNILLLEAPA